MNSVNDLLKDNNFQNKSTFKSEVTNLEVSNIIEMDTYWLEKAKIYLQYFLVNQKTSHFFGTDREVQKVIEVCMYLKYSNCIQEPDLEDFKLYNKMLNKLANCNNNEPYFIVKNDFWYSLAVENCNSIKAVKENWEFFIIKSLPRLPINIENNINLINNIKFFPRVKIIKCWKNIFLGKKFITSIDYPDKGFDITDFLTECRKINFWPDTNNSNFIISKDWLKYIDQDIIDWLIEPELHRYDESKFYLKDSIW